MWRSHHHCHHPPSHLPLLFHCEAELVGVRNTSKGVKMTLLKDSQSIGPPSLVVFAASVVIFS